jgi:acetyl esterase/lipase
MREIRQCEAAAFYKLPLYKRMRDRYPVTLTPQTTAGVYTEVFEPADGIADKNRNRVLINLHSGAFESGSRTMSHLESVPIASLGKIKVVSIDYRQSPEYEFPAASEDAEAVYRELLKTYEPQDIGIYGCSAGGMLTAQFVAWLQWKGLPTPGAVGMFCGAAYWWGAGDSGYFAAARDRVLPVDLIVNSRTNAYFKDVDPHDTLAFPGQSDETLARFPPSLLISATRDLALSSVVNTHSRLVAQGVEAELHVWEGLGHAFFYSLDLPESREAYNVIIKFFDRHLGTPAKYSGPVPTAALEAILAGQVQEFVKAVRH